MLSASSFPITTFPDSSCEIDANQNRVMNDDHTKKIDPLGLAHLFVSCKDTRTPEEKREAESKEWRRRKGTGRKNWHLKYLHELNLGKPPSSD